MRGYGLPVWGSLYYKSFLSSSRLDANFGDVSLFQTSGRKKWNPDIMKAAVTAIRKKEIESFKAFLRVP
jgi:hypothetical protein